MPAAAIDRPLRAAPPPDPPAAGAPTSWHELRVADVAHRLATDPAAGLPSSRAADLSRVHGPNELEERGGRGPARILWEQFTATMVLILVAAGTVSLFLGKWHEAGAIFAIVVLFGLLGFVQEYRAERAMAALRKLAVPSVRVRRDGVVREIPARDLVPGDVVLLEAGNVVPADLRLVESANLRVEEAALTGESEAVEKETDVVPGADVPLGDRRNLGFMGTVVAYGRGAGIVVETGMRTQLGNVATLLQKVADDQTPLQKRLDRVGKGLALAGVAIAALVAVFGVLRGETVAEMFLVAVSVAVAIVPEGLPAVVTVTLALGARRMLQRRALIRKLPAVETLGSVTVICSDKTGTLTQNRMTVTVLDLAGHRVDVTEEVRGRVPSVRDTEAPTSADAGRAQSMALLLSAGALVNDAELRHDESQGRSHTIGDPTEGALVLAAAEFGFRKPDLERAAPRAGEIPFDSSRKRMTTVHEVRGGVPGLPSDVRAVAFTKGSVDGLLGLSAHVWVEGRALPMTPEWRARIEASNAHLAGEGMRVLGVAFRALPGVPARPDLALEADLTFVGLFGMIDPPRPEVLPAVATCRAAGIRPVMITGDHPLTAQTIARDLGIAPADAARVVTGAEIERMDDAALSGSVERASVFARVAPEHKLRIVRCLQSKGHVVAMTGDGVNDAPALRQADIGVAMGITGTDVTKEAGEIVLQDDNFATIVAAVEEGRVIYDNIRKFVKFSIAGNAGKVAVMLLAPPLALALGPSPLPDLVVPLLPLQLLWLNLLTDGLLGIGLGVEPAERDVMRRAPVRSSTGIFSGGALGEMLRTGAVIGAVALAVGLGLWHAGHAGWQTAMFTTLAFAQVFQAFGSRGGTESVFRRGIGGNPVLLALAAKVVLLQLAAVYVPAMAQFLGAVPLSAADLLLCVGAGAVVLAASEAEKAVARRRAAAA